MLAMEKSRRDGRGFAVVRVYEPSRIERELLGQVFEVVTHGAGCRVDDADSVEATFVGMAGRVGGVSCVGVAPERAAISFDPQMDRQERAA